MKILENVKIFQLGVSENQRFNLKTPKDLDIFKNIPVAIATDEDYDNDGYFKFESRNDNDRIDGFVKDNITLKDNNLYATVCLNEDCDELSFANYEILVKEFSYKGSQLGVISDYDIIKVWLRRI